VSKADKTHHWRNVRCGGCSLHCRYRDFRPFAGQNVLEMVHQWLYKDSEDPAEWRDKSRGVLLGMAHQAKKEMWQEYTDKCPNWGSEEPATIFGPLLEEVVPF